MLVDNMSNSDYHSGPAISSSQIKDLVKDEEYFYKKYILKTIEKEESAAFDVGTYFHTAILEPEKLEKECVIWPSGVRRGAKWDEFKEIHKDKAIITSTEALQANAMIKAVKESKVASKLLTGGKPEISCFIDLYITGLDIYSISSRSGKVFTLSTDGWLETKLAAPTGLKVTVKARADYINIDSGYILDLKSTTGNAKDFGSIREKVSRYSYDLSAALYLDLFSMGIGTTLNHFYWIFASKDIENCKTYLADMDNIRIGRAKYSKALTTYAKCINSNWKFEDEISLLAPSYWEKEWLNLENNTNLV